MASATVTIASITRAAWSKSLSPSSWESFIRSSSASLDNAAIQSQVAAILLQLIKEAPQSPTTISYIRQSLSSSRSHAKSLLLAGYLAFQALSLLPSSDLRLLDIVFREINEVLQDASIKVYDASTQDELLRAISKICIILSPSFPFSSPSSPQPSLSSSPTIAYILLFFTRPPLHLQSPANSESASTSSETGVCSESISAALESLSSVTDSKDSGIVGSLKSHLARLARVLDAAAPGEVAATAPVDLDANTTFADPDIQFLMSDLRHQSPTPFGASNTAVSVARIASVLKLRVAQCAVRGGTVESTLTTGFLEILLAASYDLRKSIGNKIINESFVFSRVPEILRQLFTHPGFLEESLPDGPQGCLEAAVRVFRGVVKAPSSIDLDAMEIDDSSTTSLVNNLLAALCRQELISIDVGASLGEGLHPDDLMARQEDDFCDLLLAEGDYSGLRDLLNPMTFEYGSQRSMVNGLHAAIDSWAQNSDLSALNLMCKLLVDLPQILEITFLHLEPRAVFSPLRTFLESFDTASHNFGDGHPIESYGGIVLFMEVVLTRFNLHANLAVHLGTNSGFFVEWIPSLSAAYPLSALDEASKSAVNDWVGALLGEGISDDLTGSTSPEVLLRTAPTICKQCIAAYHAGVIDQPTLTEGFSYFLQELLSFTLPGIIFWLLGELERTSVAAVHSTLMDTLKVFVFSESLPRTVLEIVSSDLNNFLLRRNEKAFASASFDADALAKILSRARVGAPESLPIPNKTWIQQLSVDIETSVNPPSSPTAVNLSSSLRSSLLDHSSQELTHAVINLLSSLSQPLSTSFNEEQWLRSARLRRVGQAVFSAPSATTSSGRLYFPLLEWVARNWMTKTLSGLSTRSADEQNAPLYNRIETIAEVVGEAFAGAKQVTLEAGAIESEAMLRLTLDQLAIFVRKLRATGDGELQVAGRSLMDVFLGKFSQVDCVKSGRSWDGRA